MGRAKCARCDERWNLLQFNGRSFHLCIPCHKNNIVRKFKDPDWGTFGKEKMKVIIKSIETLKKEALDPDAHYLHFEDCDTSFNIESMAEYCGKTIELDEKQEKNLKTDGYFYLNENNWVFAKCFLIEKETVKHDPVKAKKHLAEVLKAAIGTKHDAGKGRYSLVLGGFKNALKEVVKCGTEGAKKYGDNNWMSVENGIERYTDADYRHLLEGSSEINEEDFGLLHATHHAWNALAALELILREKNDNDSN